MPSEYSETLVWSRQTLQSLLTIITVFDGTGMALEDAAAVYRAYHPARERGLGQVVDLQ